MKNYRLDIRRTPCTGQSTRHKQHITRALSLDAWTERRKTLAGGTNQQRQRKRDRERLQLRLERHLRIRHSQITGVELLTGPFYRGTHITPANEPFLASISIDPHVSRIVRSVVYHSEQTKRFSSPEIVTVKIFHDPERGMAMTALMLISNKRAASFSQPLITWSREQRALQMVLVRRETIIHRSTALCRSSASTRIQNSRKRLPCRR